MRGWLFRGHLSVDHEAAPTVFLGCQYEANVLLWGLTGLSEGPKNLIVSITWCGRVVGSVGDTTSEVTQLDTRCQATCPCPVFGASEG